MFSVVNNFRASALDIPAEFLTFCGFICIMSIKGIFSLRQILNGIYQIQHSIIAFNSYAKGEVVRSNDFFIIV